MNNGVVDKIDLQCSDMAEGLIGSEIIALAQKINARIKDGERIYNFTIGDFNPNIFPIPPALKEEIINALENNETNYPMANGMTELRTAVSNYMSKNMNIEYGADDILISGGARPLIYATFQALVNAGETVLFPVPSWNNNHYTHMVNGNAVTIETTSENNFMPTVEDLKPHIGSAALLALCSPLNPTGTVFSEETLRDICNMVLEENQKRSVDGRKPLYLMYDQIYWSLTHGNTKHVNPVSVDPAMRNYTIFIDGISKAYAATGVRVGWSFGPTKIINKMRAILSHIGAWAPKAEQIGTAKFLERSGEANTYLQDFKTEVSDRLTGLYDGFQQLKSEGYNVDAIAPQAAIYLTVRIDIMGKSLPDGTILKTIEESSQYLLDVAKIGIVPFKAFGSTNNDTWYRMSVGTCTKEDVPEVINSIRNALQQLT